MGSCPDEEHFCGGDVVYQQPVRVDVAFSNALPFAGQFVRAVAFRERAGLGQQLDYGDELLDVPTATFLSFEIVSELLPLSDSSHRAMLVRANVSSLPIPKRNRRSRRSCGRAPH